MFFWMLTGIYAIEYIGAGHYFPPAAKLPLFLSFGIFLYVVLTNPVTEVIRHRQTKLLGVFFLHTCLSLLYALVTFWAFRIFKVQTGYLILFVSTFFLVRDIKKIYYFMAAFVLFHMVVVVVNLDKMHAQVRSAGFTAGYFLGDGNDLAWSLTIFLGFVFYLFSAAPSKIIKLAVLGAFGVFMLGIVGTGSRGAFLALTASFGYLVLQSKYKIAALCIAVLAAFTILTVAPATYVDRIRSIGSFQEDSSALGRIMAWKAAARMATDNPLGVGAGNFNSAYGRFYRPSEVDSRIWRPQRWISPHSVYFLVLGEYGFIGVIVLLALLYANFTDNHKMVRQVAAGNTILDPALARLPKYLNMSLVAYAVGGLFLGGVNYPHIFILTCLILRAKTLFAEAVAVPQEAEEVAQHAD